MSSNTKADPADRSLMNMIKGRSHHESGKSKLKFVPRTERDMLSKDESALSRHPSYKFEPNATDPELLITSFLRKREAEENKGRSSEPEIRVSVLSQNELDHIKQAYLEDYSKKTQKVTNRKILNFGWNVDEDTAKDRIIEDQHNKRSGLLNASNDYYVINNNDDEEVDLNTIREDKRGRRRKQTEPPMTSWVR
jgi:hypothetical protein